MRHNIYDSLGLGLEKESSLGPNTDSPGSTASSNSNSSSNSISKTNNDAKRHSPLSRLFSPFYQTKKEKTPVEKLRESRDNFNEKTKEYLIFSQKRVVI
jgi:hypothetical protein